MSGREGGGASLTPSPPPQLSSLAILRVIRTASDDSCGGGLGTRLGRCPIIDQPQVHRTTSCIDAVPGPRDSSSGTGGEPTILTW